MLLSCIPTAFADDNISITIPDKPQAPDILKMLDKDTPTSVAEYDFVYDLSVEQQNLYTLSQNGTYLFYASDPESYVRDVRIDVSENTIAYISLDDIAFAGLTSDQGTNLEVNIIGSVETTNPFELTGAENLVISGPDKNTATLSMTAPESTKTYSLFTGDKDTVANNLWILSCSISVEIPGAPPGTLISEVTAENALIAYFNNVHIYDSVLSSSIVTYDVGSGGISADSLYIDNSTINMKRAVFSPEESLLNTTQQTVITNSSLSLSSEGTNTYGSRSGCISSKDIYFGNNKMEIYCDLYDFQSSAGSVIKAENQISMKNNTISAYFTKGTSFLTSAEFNSVNSRMDVFSLNDAVLFDAGILRLSEDTFFHYWSSQSRTENEENIFSADRLNSNESSIDLSSIFETNLSSRSIADNKQNWFDLIFYCTDGEIIPYLFPEFFQTLAENGKSADLKNGYFATNETQEIKNKQFYIFQCLYLEENAKLLENATVETALNLIGSAFGYDSAQAALEHLDETVAPYGCTSEDLFYQSVKTCIEECFKYDGTTFTAEDVVATFEKSKNEVNSAYFNVFDKEHNPTAWANGSKIDSSSRGLMQQYLEFLEAGIQYCTSIDNTDFYTQEGFARYLRLQSFLYFGGTLKDYGGDSEIDKHGTDLVPLSYKLPDGTYDMCFTYGTAYFDTLKVRSVAIGTASTLFNCARAMYYLPEGRTLKDAGLSRTQFPSAFDMSDVLKYLPADEVLTDYMYVVSGEYHNENKRINDISTFVFAPEDYFEQFVNFETDTKYCTVRYNTNGLGKILTVSGKEQPDIVDVRVPFGYSIEYTEKNDGNVKVHNSFASAAAISNTSYYFKPFDEQMEIVGWTDETGELFDLTKPIVQDEELILTPVLQPKDQGPVSFSITIQTEDNSTENFNYSYTEPFKTASETDFEFVNMSGMDAINYIGNSTAVYIPFDASYPDFLMAFGEKCIGTENDGVIDFEYFPDFSSVSPLKKLKIGNGYTVAYIYPDTSNFVAFYPSSLAGVVYIDSSYQMISELPNATIYYSYAGNAKAMILEDISSNKMSAQEVAKKYCHFCNDNLEPLSIEQQQETLSQLLKDAGLSSAGIIPLETQTPVTNEADWQVNPNDPSEIIAYTGEYYPYIGIPETINGVPIQKVNTAALGNSNAIYSAGGTVGIYVPAGITNISAGYKDLFAVMNPSAEVTVTGTDDMCIFSMCPNAYVVVDEDNPNYSSYKGSLYNKTQDYLYYLGGSLTETTILPSVTRFSAYALTVTFGASNAVQKMTFLGTEPVEFNTVTLTMDGSTMYFGGFITTDQMSGEKTIAPVNFVCAKDSPFHHAWISQVQEWLDESGNTGTTAEEGAEFFLTLVDPNTYEDPNTSISFEEYSDTIYGQFNIYEPFTQTYSKTDDTDYIFSLLDIPDRYVSPSFSELKINPSVSTENITIYLRLKRGTANIYTYSEAGQSPISNVIYEITNLETGEKVTTEASNELGEICFDELAYGSYSVSQKSVPGGWKINETPQTFSITEDGQIVELSFVNESSQVYSCRIPKTLILDGSTGNANYYVGVKGSLSAGSVVSIVPQSTFTLSSPGKSSVIASVEQPMTEWQQEDVSMDNWATAQGTITAPISAGSWAGTFEFKISIS